MLVLEVDVFSTLYFLDDLPSRIQRVGLERIKATTLTLSCRRPCAPMAFCKIPPVCGERGCGRLGTEVRAFRKARAIFYRIHEHPVSKFPTKKLRTSFCSGLNICLSLGSCSVSSSIACLKKALTASSLSLAIVSKSHKKLVARQKGSLKKKRLTDSHAYVP